MLRDRMPSTVEHLHRAAIEVARGFEQMQGMPEDQQAEALREASAALIEMRRACDILAQQRRFRISQ